MAFSLTLSPSLISFVEFLAGWFFFVCVVGFFPFSNYMHGFSRRNVCAAYWSNFTSGIQIFKYETWLTNQLPRRLQQFIGVFMDESKFGNYFSTAGPSRTCACARSPIMCQYPILLIFVARLKVPLHNFWINSI